MKKLQDNITKLYKSGSFEKAFKDVGFGSLISFDHTLINADPESVSIEE
jgi:hypothetical protein